MNVQQPQSSETLSGPGAERTDNDSHPRGLLLPRAVPPAAKFSLRSIACLTLQGRRARDRRGPCGERPRKLGGRWRRPEEQAPYLGYTEWPGARAGGAWGGEGARGGGVVHHGLGRCPRLCPRRLLFLPRARHVTAIKHVCALRRGDFLILRRSRAPRTRPRRRRRTHRHRLPPSRRQTPPGLRPAPGRARAGGAARAARHALVPSALHARSSPPPPPAPPPDLWPCQTFFFFRVDWCPTSLRPHPPGSPASPALTTIRSEQQPG